MRHHEAKPIRCGHEGCYARATRTRGDGLPHEQVCAHHMEQGNEPGHYWYIVLPADCRVCGQPIKPFRATFWQHDTAVLA